MRIPKLLRVLIKCLHMSLFVRKCTSEKERVGHTTNTHTHKSALSCRISLEHVLDGGDGLLVVNSTTLVRLHARWASAAICRLRDLRTRFPALAPASQRTSCLICLFAVFWCACTLHKSRCGHSHEPPNNHHILISPNATRTESKKKTTIMHNKSFARSPADCVLGGAHVFAAVLFLHVGDVHVADDVVVYGDILTHQKAAIVWNLHTAVVWQNTWKVC